MSSVDVVIPCYNYAHFLGRCVSSVLAQTGVDVRILIIDDASSDNSEEVGTELAKASSCITFRRSPKNKGLIPTANEGIMDWATAKYCLLLSADDALTEGALGRAAKVMDDHDDVGMTYGMSYVISDDLGTIEPPHSDTFRYRIVPGPQFLRQVCEHWQGVPTPTAVVRTDLQHRIGGYHPALRQTSDAEMWMRIATQGPIAAIHTPQGYYRWHGANMSSAYTGRALSDLDEQYKTIQEVYATWGANIEGFSSWIEIAKLRLARQAYWMAGLAIERGDLAGAASCFNFAKEVCSSPWLMPSWWKAHIKKMAGPNRIGEIKRWLGQRSPSHIASFAPFNPGKIFGWWPEASEFSASMSSREGPESRSSTLYPEQRRVDPAAAKQVPC
ncbi:MAG: glycosyltransferase [Acidobacteriaceae bacterium]|nr:glycosyltransferase [Acidobacteriaceae bacterium]